MVLRSTLLLSVVGVMACASGSESDVTTNVDPTLPASSGTANLPAEPDPLTAFDAQATSIVRQVQATVGDIKETHYQHTTHVVPADGVFDADCSGFLNYILGKAAPTQLSELEAATEARPLAKDYVSFLGNPPSASSGWKSVATVAELRPGDIVAWLLPPGASDSGHVMVVRNTPVRRDASSFVVDVWDSVDSPHGANDSRAAKKATGIGYGEIVLLVDANGAPTGHEWSEGGMQVRQQTVLGRAL